MAVNLPPQYHDAEARYKKAQTPEDKLAALKEMWVILPKHKASEKVQADLKTQDLGTDRPDRAGEDRARRKPRPAPSSSRGRVPGRSCSLARRMPASRSCLTKSDEGDARRSRRIRSPPASRCRA